MFCKNCGTELSNNAVICPKCGCPTELYLQDTKTQETPNGLKVAAKVFMILNCVIKGFLYITLAWTIPMTVVYCSKIKDHEKISVGFKICSLLFVSLIAGILMLCDGNEKFS